MKTIILTNIKVNFYYLFPVLLFYCFAAYRIWNFSKIDNHVFFNQWVGNVYIDNFFKYITHLGDGLFLLFIVILWSFKNLRQSLILLLSYIIAGGSVAILKNYIFEVKRPHFVFDYYHKDIFIKYVDCVDILALNSFPSGHSTSVFILCSFLAFHLHQHYQKLLLGVFAIIIAFSRVYLSQHWINDIFVGSLTGLIITLFIHSVFDRYRFLDRYNQSIQSFLKI